MDIKNLSSEEKRTLIQSALNPQATLDIREAPAMRLWVRDVYDDKVIYGSGDKYFQVDYSMNKDGTVKFGNPIQVIAKTTYEPIESTKFPFLREKTTK